MSIVDVIVKAIENKKSLSFAYHGHERVVSPFAVGVNGVNEVKLIAFQTGGGSTSGVTEKLRFFTVEDIVGPELCDAPYKEPCLPCQESFKELVTIYAKYEKKSECCCAC